jgi:hypothetical protein
VRACVLVDPPQPFAENVDALDRVTRRNGPASARLEKNTNDATAIVKDKNRMKNPSTIDYQTNHQRARAVGYLFETTRDEPITSSRFLAYSLMSRIVMGESTMSDSSESITRWIVCHVLALWIWSRSFAALAAQIASASTCSGGTISFSLLSS